jgi:hypothetical protein
MDYRRLVLIARRFSRLLNVAAPVFVYAIMSPGHFPSNSLAASDRMPDFLAPSLRSAFLRHAVLII